MAKSGKRAEKFGRIRQNTEIVVKYLNKARESGTQTYICFYWIHTSNLLIDFLDIYHYISCIISDNFPIFLIKWQRAEFFEKMQKWAEFDNLSSQRLEILLATLVPCSWSPHWLPQPPSLAPSPAQPQHPLIYMLFQFRAGKKVRVVQNHRQVCYKENSYFGT